MVADKTELVRAFICHPLYECTSSLAFIVFIGMLPWLEISKG